jgi:hypothetical protein
MESLSKQVISSLTVIFLNNFLEIKYCKKTVAIASYLNPLIKVRKFQNEFMKSSFLPKYEQKNIRISALCSEGRNLDSFLFVIWEKR